MSADSIMDAVGYLLTRCQTDPDLAYYLSPETEAWQRLTAAEAAHLGRDVEAHRQDRRQDRQPEYRRCEARAVVAARRIDIADELVDVVGSALDRVGSGCWVGEDECERIEALIARWRDSR